MRGQAKNNMSCTQECQGPAGEASRDRDQGEARGFFPSCLRGSVGSKRSEQWLATMTCGLGRGGKTMQLRRINYSGNSSSTPLGRWSSPTLRLLVISACTIFSSPNLAISEGQSPGIISTTAGTLVDEGNCVDAWNYLWKNINGGSTEASASLAILLSVPRLSPPNKPEDSTFLDHLLLFLVVHSIDFPDVKLEGMDFLRNSFLRPAWPIATVKDVSALGCFGQDISKECVALLHASNLLVGAPDMASYFEWSVKKEQSVECWGAGND